MKKMNKMRFLAKTIISSFVLLAIFTACEVGLGSNVDTAAPKIEILSPEPSSTHKGEFQITGTASDEIAVRSVSVNLLENGTARYSYKANYDAASGKWSVSIPTLDENNKPIVEDLKYEIQAIATDTDGKTSVATRSVQVDNSAPTVLVTSPSLFNENKSTFFRQLRVSGSAYDASEISSVKVSFYKESKEGEVPFELVEGETMLTFTAEGTNTWELTKDLDEKDTFFANNTIYNFFVVAEDITGNKNTYFFRYGDFYKPGILEDVNKDSFISFPSMQQIGKLDQGFDIENATSNLTAQKLETIQIPCSSDGINDSNFYYRSQTASNVSWGNIENNDSSEPKQIPMEMDITGQIKSTDGTDILTNSIRFEIYSLDDNENWIVPSENMELDSSGSTVAFTIKLQKEAEEYIKSGHYRITVYYQTIASQNSDPLSAEKIFDISAGMPILTETGLSEKGTSPFNLQVFTNKDSVVLSGRALKGDRRTPVDMISVICNENSYESPEIAADGTWSIKITEEGTYSFELKVEDGGNTTTVTRTVIIDRTKPLIDNLGFNQNSAKNAVTISSFITDENAIESIHYAFVKGDSVTLENLDSTEWKKADNKSAMNIALEEPNGFEQGPWTLFVKATDKAGNIENKQYTGVLDLDAPAFTTSFATDSIPENGYLNKDFSYLSSILDNSTVIAADNYKIKEVKITAKKDGVVQNEYGYTKTIEKAQLTKADFDKLPIIEAKTTNEGKWIVTFEIYDLNNNKAEKTVDFSMDVTKPTVSIEKVPQAKDDNTSPFEFRGSASDNVSGVSTINISLDGSNFESFEGLKSWGKELAITEKGKGWVFAYAVDGAGNQSETVKEEFIFDSSKPTLNITTQEGLTDWNIGTNFGLEGTVSDDWGLPESPVTIKQYEKSDESLTNEILLSGVSFVDGKWSIPDLPRKNPAEKIEEADIPTKTYTYVIEAKDNAGKESTKTVNVSIDKTAPSKNEISTPKDKLETNAINSETFTFTGVAEDLEGDARTGINKIQYAIKTTDTEPTENELKDIATTGSWKFVNEEKLTEGEYFLFVRAVDNAGNKTAFAKEKYQVDFNNPEIDISLDAKQKGLFPLAGTISDKDATGQSNGKNITIEITQVGNLDKNKQPLVITPAVEGIKLTTINLPVKSVEGQGVSITEDEIHDYNDTYTYTIKVTDWCGKTVEKTITTKLDTKAPVIELYSLSKSDSSQNEFKTESISLTGSLSDDSKITKLAYMTKLASEDKPNYEASGWTVKENKNTINEELSFTEAEYGNRILYIWAEDENGNKSSIEEYNFLVDAKAPELTLTSSENAQINAGESYKLSLEATDSLLDKVVVTAKKDGVTQTGIDAETGIWFEKTANGGTVITLEGEEILKGAGNEGKWVFSVKAYDMAGGVSDTETISVLVDTTNPEFKTDVNQPHIESTFGPVTVDGKDWYGGQTITLKGQVSDNNEIETVEYLIVEEAEGASYESCSVTKIGDGEYEFKADISVTEHWKEKTIKIKAFDKVKNKIETSLTINVDRNVPTIEIISNTSNIFIRSETDLTLALDCDDAECGVKSVKAKIGSPDFNDFDAETKSDTITILAEKFGEYEGNTGKVYLQVEDNCGNTAQTSFTFEKDTTSPKVKITSHSAGDTVNGKITLSGTTSESQGLAKVEIFVDGSDTASKIFEGNDGFNWSYEIDTTKIYNGTETKDLSIKVVATDNAGNKSEAQEITLTIDQKSDRPEITLNNVSSGEAQYLTDTMILGVISDDDGPITALKIAVKPESGEIDWNNIPKTTVTKAGSFGFILSGDDGKTELCFKVEANGATFETEKSLLEQPKIMDVDEKEVKNGLVVFNLDTNTPDINTENTKLIFGDNPEGEIFANNIQVGGKRKEFALEVQATDGNGIKEVTLEVEGISDSYELKKDGENWKKTVDTTAIENGLKTFKITVVDNAGASATLSKQILVDNQAPAIDIESHTIGETVLGKTRISGTTTDDINGISGSGIKSVKWLVAKDTVLETKTSDDDIIDLFINPTEEVKTYSVKGTLSWNYSFGDNNDNLGELVTNGYGSDIGNEIYELPIFFLIEDNVGNQKLEKIRLNVDPNGDKPRPFVSYPTDGAKLGGTVRINGTTEIAEGTVGKVYIQLGSVGDSGTFAPFEKSAFETWFAEKDCPYTFATIEGETVIEATGTVAWNITINSNNEFNLDSGFTGLTEEDDLSYVSFRVRAINTENKLGAWTEPITISLDKNAPKIANPRLVKYEGGNEIASKDYISGDWISGDDWCLVTTIEDENGLASIEVTNKSDNATIDFEKIEDVSANEKKEVKIPLKTKTFSGNIFSFSLSATDNSEENNRSEKLISLKFDNTPPDLEPLKHDDKDIDKENNPIEQDNNGFDISSSITEKNNGSDLDRILLCFKHTALDYYYVPMVNEDEKSVLSQWTGSLNNENLPSETLQVSRSDERTIIVTGINKFIKAGGVVRIGNMLCRIESVDYSTGTVTIDTDVPTNFTEAEFIYALVIDHINGGEYINQDTGELENDDDDGFEEKLSLTGSTYDWSVVINSKEISDGPVTVYYLAYDKAGNCSETKAQEAMVQNNRPTIAKIWLGTDLNGDNGITPNEEVLYREDETRDTADGSVTLMAADFTAKGRTSIRPEIVGGNDNLYYYEKNTVDENDYKINRKLLREGEDNEKAEDDEAIYLELEEDKNKIITLAGKYDTGTVTNLNETETFTFKIWDSTPGLTPGDNSLSATITVSMKIDVVDGVAPTVVIDPLYWNSKTDNSLYEKSTGNGHIDLSADLPEVFKDSSESSGVMDRDDKVSGKITFTGTAYDDVRLSSISFSFDKFTGTATYSGNTWTNPDSTIDSGFEFIVEEVSLDQGGHKVNWTLSIDTEKINGVASADVNLTVSATDKGSNSSSTEKVESEDKTKKNVPFYKVDVVPYITGVQTALSGVNKRYPTSVSRSALGKYPVSDGEEVTFTGFNLGATTYKVSQSGVYSHTVNEITALNNLNNDDAHGTYKGELNQDNYAEYAYNRQPNNYNNNLLTDDVEFVVWQFDSDAVIPKSGKIEQPIMKINPNSKEVGFAFVNGPLYFSMGGNNYSYRYWMGSYDFFTSVGFTYDDLGYSYGVAAGGDINSSEADKFQFMTSRWGRAGLGQGGSYANTNSLRLESIAMKINETNYYDKQRIKSPAFATTVNETTTNIYLAYYDAMNDEIRFKAGSTNSTTRTNFGSFSDYDTDSAPYDYRNGKVSMIAGSNTNRNAGEYISLGAIKGVQTDGSDVVVVVWYGSDRTLWYSYTTSSPLGRDDQTDGRGWSSPVSVFSGDMANAGEYCKVTIDKDGGIHIAAYDPVNLDLCYAYLDSYNDSSFETCVVDSNGVTGSNLTLDVAKDSEDGNWIPYIGYYATYCIKPKYAYKVDTSSMNPAGSVDDMFTQAWESMVVPTSSTIEMQSNQHNDINIAVWKNKDSGVLENSKTGTNSHDTNNNGYNNDAFGYVYGNGTSNPIMGYAIKSGASQNTIETAQLK